MSRIGKLQIIVPTGVTVEFKGADVHVKGPKGALHMNLRPEIVANMENNVIKLTVVKESRETSAYWGLDRALLSNMVKGVAEGFEKKLELVGVGYRVKQAGANLAFTLGYSHPIEFVAPQGITLTAVDQTNITILGADKRVVGQVAADIRKLRKPEPYKGKGIKYAGEVIKRKVGKSAKA